MAKDIPTTKDGYCPLYGFTGKCDAVKRLKTENEKLKKEIAHETDMAAQADMTCKRAYSRGYEEGVRAYAWWKDGVQYVGTCGKTLEQALKEK